MIVAVYLMLASVVFLLIVVVIELGEIGAAMARVEAGLDGVRRRTGDLHVKHDALTHAVQRNTYGPHGPCR